MSPDTPDTLIPDFAKGDGLLPAIVQDTHTLQVLMLGYMNAAAYAATCATREVTFYSRSRQTLWRKGEVSGNVLDLVAIELDCDRDAILISAAPRGPTCHLGRTSCFAQSSRAELAALDRLLADRHAHRPANSYSTRLFDEGVRRIAQKVGEEGVETALAAVVQDDDALLGEAADLAYHLLALLRVRGLGLADLERVLAQRSGS